MEKWLPLQYNGENLGEFYEVSSHGRLRNTKTKKIRKLHLNRKGYVRCYASFIPNPNNLPQVNHIDGDKTNNNISNLEWVTNKENRRHAVNTGLAHLISVRGIHKITGEIVEFKSISEAERFLGHKNRNNICNVIHNRNNRKTSGGYYWERI